MKRLAVVSSSFFPFAGGQEIGLEVLLSGILQSAGCEICVVTPRYDRRARAEETLRGVRVLRYETTAVRYPRSLAPHQLNVAVHGLYARFAVPRLLKKLNPDRILAYFLSPTAFPAVRHAKANGIRCAVFLGGSDIHHTMWPIGGATRFALQNADFVIAASEFVRDCARMNFGVVDKPFFIVPYAIDLSSFPEVPKDLQEPLRLLCVQRLVASKGTDILIKALRRLVDMGHAAVGLDIVGDGPQRAQLEGLAETLGLRERVTFHGEQPRERVVAFFQRSRVFCFPTLSEGFGIVLLEAMATGNIIIASRCTAIPETVKHGETGLLFEPGSAESLASTLDPVLRRPDRFGCLAAAARDAVRDFDVSRVGKRLAGLLDGPSPDAEGPVPAWT